jgi:hypothetical protein
MERGIDPAYGVLIPVVMGFVALAWAYWSDRRFIRKYGPDPSDAPPASRGEG